MVHKVVDGLTALNVPYDILLMGQKGVGKTSLIYKYVCDCWDHPSTSHAGQFHSTCVSLPNNVHSSSASSASIYHDLTILDSTSLSQGSYSSRRAQQVKNARTIIFAYSVADRESFEAVQYDIEAVQMMRNDDLPPFVVAGLKLDMYDRETLYQEGADFAQKYRAIAFCEVSSRDGTNVEDVFSPLVEVIFKNKLDRQEAGALDMLSLMDVLSENPDTLDVNRSLHKESSGEIALIPKSAVHLQSQRKPTRTSHKDYTHPQADKTGCCIIM